jgi:hypothetical protein
LALTDEQLSMDSTAAIAGAADVWAARQVTTKSSLPDPLRTSGGPKSRSAATLT